MSEMKRLATAMLLGELQENYQQVRDMAAVQSTVGFKGPKVVSMPTEQDRRNAIADMAMHNNVSMSQETINRLARIKE